MCLAGLIEWDAEVFGLKQAQETFLQQDPFPSEEEMQLNKHSRMMLRNLETDSRRLSRTVTWALINSPKCNNSVAAP